MAIIVFVNEDGVKQEHKGYITRTCVYCQKPFIVGADDLLTRDCGRDDEQHRKEPPKEFAR